MRQWMMAGLVAALTACGADRTPTNETGEAPASPAPAATNQAVAPSPKIERAVESRYTPVTDKACTTISSDKETGDWSGACPGFAGYKVELSSGDLRDDLTFVRGSTRTSLDLPRLVANGAFDTVGEAIEWRGADLRDPEAVIVRVAVANDQGENDGGRLAVARLRPRPCVIGVVNPQPGQNAKARAIADREPLTPCLGTAQ